MENVFCAEPIIAVYEGERQFYSDMPEANAFFDCYHELAYHVTEGYRLLLETESFCISLDARGVTRTRKSGPLQYHALQDELLEPCDHPMFQDDRWIDHLSTIFVGEQLLQVEPLADGYLLHFNDFRLKLLPHPLGEKDFPSLRSEHPHAYHRVLGADRHLTRRCECGGKGELLLNFVSDFLIRCRNCKRSTEANIMAADAIAAWNEGQTPCLLTDIVIES